MQILTAIAVSLFVGMAGILLGSALFAQFIKNTGIQLGLVIGIVAFIATFIYANSKPRQ